MDLREHSPAQVTGAMETAGNSPLIQLNTTTHTWEGFNTGFLHVSCKQVQVRAPKYCLASTRLCKLCVGSTPVRIPRRIHTRSLAQLVQPGLGLREERKYFHCNRFWQFSVLCLWNSALHPHNKKYNQIKHSNTTQIAYPALTVDTIQWRPELGVNYCGLYELLRLD